MRADIELKREQTNWEPWKAMAAPFGAGAALFGALFGVVGAVVGYLLAHH